MVPLPPPFPPPTSHSSPRSFPARVTLSELDVLLGLGFSAGRIESFRVFESSLFCCVSSCARAALETGL